MIYPFVKRCVDVFFATTVILFFWWLFALIWLFVRFDSEGSPIFVQERVGIDGKLFKCMKFRTMSHETPQAGTHQISSNYVTRVGRVLRRTKLDELPQVWNILRNEISLVGPRPCLPSQVKLMELRETAGIFRIKPGITGLAQVNNIDMSAPEQLVAWDLDYLNHRCFSTDALIIISTIIGFGQGDRIRKEV